MTKKTRQKLIRLSAYVVVVLSLALTIPVGSKIFFPDSITIKKAIIFHICAAILFSLGFFLLTDEREIKSRFSREKRGNVWWVYVFISSFALPLYGIVTSLVIYIIQRVKKTLPPPIVSDEITVQNPEIFRKIGNLSKQLAILDRKDIEPFVDIFRSGSSELKKSAVKLLGSIRSKKSIKTLMMALLDDDIEIRLFAAGILSRIEDEYAIDIKNKVLEYNQHRGDEKLGLELVDIYLSYAEIGLLDTIARTYYYNETLKVLDELPDSPDISRNKAHIHFELGNFAEAEKNARAYLKINSDDARIIQLLWRIQFSQAEYGDLEQSISITKKKEVKGLRTDVVNYWTE